MQKTDKYLLDPRGICQTRHILRKPDTVSLGYGAAVFNNKGCCGAIGVAVNLPIAEERAFADEDARIHKLLERGVCEINRRLKGL